MKLFLLKVFAFLLPIIFLLSVMECAIRAIPNDYEYKRKYLDSNSSSLVGLVLGSSHSFYGVNPEFLGKNYFNASHVSQSLEYDLAILNKYVDRLTKLKYIFLPVSYFTMTSKLADGVESWRVKNYCLYYDIRQSRNPADYFEVMSNSFRSISRQIYSYYFRNQTNITCNELGWGSKGTEQKDLFDTGKTAAKRHTSDSKHFHANVELLKAIVATALEKKCAVILFTPPAYKTYVIELNQQQLYSTYDAIKKVKDQFPNCYYLNLLEDPTFQSQDFYDADHLNASGAEKLSMKLSEFAKWPLGSNGT